MKKAKFHHAKKLYSAEVAPYSHVARSPFIPLIKTIDCSLQTSGILLPIIGIEHWLPFYTGLQMDGASPQLVDIG